VPIVYKLIQEWLDTRCQDTACLATLWTRLHAWSQLEKVVFILVSRQCHIHWHMTLS